MSHATARAPARPMTDGFRVIYHEPLCPDCGSDHIVTCDVETGDGITETAHQCRSCGAAWPVACVAEWGGAS